MEKILPDYQIILWDTHKIDINSNLWLKQTYENKKYAFASDFIRCYALFHYGGIYLDADVEVIKSFTPLLNKQIIIGEEASGDIEAAVLGAEKGAPWLKACLEYYQNRPFIKPDGSFDTKPIPILLNFIRKNTYPTNQSNHITFSRLKITILVKLISDPKHSVYTILTGNG